MGVSTTHLGLAWVFVVSLSFSGTAFAGAPERIDGTFAGAEYSVLRPHDWNGDLVMLVHGSLPELFEAISPGFLAQGYGVAFAALPEGLGDGAALRRITRDSRIAEAAFRWHFDRPERTYLVGYSRGAHTIQRLLERRPRRYSGMLSLCGGNGGAQLQWDHFFTARVLFDVFFPGVLPGTPESMPPSTVDEYLDGLAPQIAFALITNPEAAIELGSVEQLNLVWNDFDELVGAVIESLAVHSVGVNDLIATARGNPFDNDATYYTGTSDDAALNRDVARFVPDRRARAYLRRWYEPRGRTWNTPVLLVHTERDGVAPEIANNDRYTSLLSSKGNSEWLVRRVVDRAGHCNILPDELFGSFADLVTWAKTGNRPEP